MTTKMKFEACIQMDTERALRNMDVLIETLGTARYLLKEGVDLTEQERWHAALPTLTAAMRLIEERTGEFTKESILMPIGYALFDLREGIGERS